jgi:hypothetical protein
MEVQLNHQMAYYYPPFLKEENEAYGVTVLSDRLCPNPVTFEPTGRFY